MNVHQIAEIIQANELNAFASQKLSLLLILKLNTLLMDMTFYLKRVAQKHIKDSIPFIYTIDQNGLFSKDMPSTHDLETLEKKRGGENWYRGYNRNVLLIELKKLLN